MGGVYNDSQVFHFYNLMQKCWFLEKASVEGKLNMFLDTLPWAMYLERFVGFQVRCLVASQECGFSLALEVGS